jgi:hypothetical protein
MEVYMTVRSIFDRLDNSPAPSADSWAGRKPPFVEPPLGKTVGVLGFASNITANPETIFRENMARRDADAAQYGEPESPREFYRGRPGSQAETIVLDALRALQALQVADRLYVNSLMDSISQAYLATTDGPETSRRRIMALLRIAAEVP